MSSWAIPPATPATLTRSELAHTATPATDLALDAERTLGYSVLRRTLGVPGPLGAALHALGISPYDAGIVEAYKEDAATAANVRNRTEFPGTCSTVRWERTPLQGYVGDVPARAVALALTIHRAFPDVVFYVDEITGDPFLVATTPDEEYYVEHWAEGGVFEGVEE